MDNTKLAMNLLRYADNNYPLNRLRKDEFKEQSARRWAIFEYVSALLDRPSKDPIMVLELLIGRLACMISHLSVTNKDEMLEPYKASLSTLIVVEEKLTNGAFK